MRILFIGIVLLVLSTLAGTAFNTIIKILGSNLFKWYHFFSIGNSFAVIVFLFFLSFVGGIKKHIILKKKEDYIIPIFRGLIFIPIFILVFFTIEKLPINIFVTLLMTTPFFIIMFSKILQKEKLNYLSWIAVLMGFIGVILVLKPWENYINIFFILPIIFAACNGFNFVIVNKFSHVATSYGFTFYFFLPVTLFSLFYFFFDPMMPSYSDLALVCSAGVLVLIAILFWTAAFHLAGKYSSLLSPFYFTSIIWAALSGKIFFSEILDFMTFFGIVTIIFSGSIAMYNNNIYK